jgi:hypothetical protein
LGAKRWRRGNGAVEAVEDTKMESLRSGGDQVATRTDAHACLALGRGEELKGVRVYLQDGNDVLVEASMELFHVLTVRTLLHVPTDVAAPR